MKENKYLPTIIILSAALIFGSISAAPLQVPSGDCHYFDDTRHYVCDPFLDFFINRGGGSIQGGIEIFGYPISEAFIDPQTGLWVQYFQRVRMEHHPYNASHYQVQLGLLADELGYDDFPTAEPSQIPPRNNALRHYFAETGHVVAYEFLRYFRQHGDLDIFGLPRSEMMYEDGYLVQYFQRARLEWHPESIDGPQMRLTNLGEIYVEQIGIPEQYMAPVYPERFGNPITHIDVSASVRDSVVSRGGTQTIFVYVSDQQQESVANATIQMTVVYPSGETQTFNDLALTNASSGFTSRSFDVLPAAPGQRITINVTATCQGLSDTTQSSFIIWW